MKSTIEIAWAAGFLEGEGWFGLCGRRPGKPGGSTSIVAVQLQRQPLERIQSLFGGTIREAKDKRIKKGPLWRWSISAKHAAAAMMTVYTLMSPKRKAQIVSALNVWSKTAVAHKDRLFCPNGHAHTGKTNSRGRRICAECRRLDAVRYRERKRAREAA